MFDYKADKNRVSGDLIKRGLFILIVCTLILGYIRALSLVNFYGFAAYAQPDMYSDTLVARYMWEGKTLFPDGWIFGNQYYVIATPVLATLFYGITGSMNTSMALATTVMTFLLFIFLYKMLQPYVPLRYRLLAILTFAASNMAIDIWRNWECQLLFLLASYYACYMITVFVVFGDYVKSVTKEKGRRLFSLVLSVALCFCTGMQSIRQTAIMIVPLVSFEFLRILYCRIIKKMSCDTAFFKPTFHVLIYTVSNVLGILFIKYLNIPCNTIYGNMGFTGPNGWEKNLNNAIVAIKQIVGYGDAQSHRNDWFITVFVVLTIAYVVIALVKILLSKKWGGVEYYIILCVISIVELFVGSIFFDFYTRSIYFFLWFPTVALSQVYLLLIMKNKWKPVLALLILSLCAMNLHYSYHQSIFEVNYWNKYAADEEVTGREEAKWLCENGYEVVYGSYYSLTPIVTESDGRLIGGYWLDDIGMFVAVDHVNSMKIYSPEMNEKAAYYIHDSDLPKAMEYAEPYGGLTCLVRFGDTGLYRCDEQLMIWPE